MACWFEKVAGRLEMGKRATTDNQQMAKGPAKWRR